MYKILSELKEQMASLEKTSSRNGACYSKKNGSQREPKNFCDKKIKERGESGVWNPGLFARKPLS